MFFKPWACNSAGPTLYTYNWVLLDSVRKRKLTVHPRHHIFIVYADMLILDRMGYIVVICCQNHSQNLHRKKKTGFGKSVLVHRELKVSSIAFFKKTFCNNRVPVRFTFFRFLRRRERSCDIVPVGVNRVSRVARHRACGYYHVNIKQLYRTNLNSCFVIDNETTRKDASYIIFPPDKVGKNLISMTKSNQYNKYSRKTNKARFSIFLTIYVVFGDFNKESKCTESVGNYKMISEKINLRFLKAWLAFVFFSLFSTIMRRAA
ncbi:hypothetical protein BDA99DRAFT_541125 [Phascolomyces articulosus]|uniref:Uncharacterized protein n=1 Tax=Phascolomyces articulosus TaxID=60185 RepID=A0AAD5PBW9_9FUNG|nr:hypothetical protein BDA99DRAFT_541125 [Phascolomyces articulosus]